MGMTIDELELRIQADASSASASVDKLTSSLTSLKGATSNAAGLSKVVKQMESLNAAAGYLNLTGFSSQMGMLTEGLSKLSGLGTNKLTGFISQLSKIPEVTKNLGESDIGKFAEGINRVAAAVRPLADEMQKIAMGFSALPKRIQSFINQMDKSGKTAGTAAQGYRSAANSLGLLNQKFNAAALIYGLKRVIGFFGGFVDNSNQYIEDINLFTVAMGDYADAAFDYAQKAQELMGIDAGAFMRNQGIFMSISKGFGTASDQAALLSKNLTMLGYDLASFYNSDIETAMQKLQSGIAGELEPLRRWGFALDQATLQQVAYSHGIQMNMRDMTQAQKSLIRYIAIMEQSTDAQHDMARTLESPANALRVFHMQVQLLGRSIGNLLIPILTKVLPYVIAFVKVLQMAATALASLFGVNLDFSNDAFKNMGVGLSDAAGGASDLEDSMGGAAAQAKKIKDYVMGFDELNIISPPDPSSSGGSGGSAGGGGGFSGLDLPEYDFMDGLTKKADALIEPMKKLAIALASIAGVLALIKGIKAFVDIYNWVKDLSPALKSLLKPILGIAMALGGATVFVLSFKNAWTKGVDWKNLAGMLTGLSFAVAGMLIAFGPIAAVITAVVGGIALIVVGIRDIIENGKNLWNTLSVVVGILATGIGIAIAVASVIPAIIAAVVAAVAAIVIWWDEIKAGFFSFLDWLNTKIIEPIVGFFSQIGSAIAAPFIAAWDFIKSVWEPVQNWFDTNIIQPLSHLFLGVGKAIGEFLSQAWAIITALWAYAATWFDLNVITPVKTFFKSLMDSIGKFMSSAWESVKGVWNAVATWFDINIIQPIGNAFSALAEGILGAFENVKNFFSALGDAIGNAFKGAINVVIDGLNFLIRALNKMSFKIPAVGDRPETTVGFNISEIPRLKVGMDYVPSDYFPAFLDKGEAVLTAKEAAVWRGFGGLNGLKSGNITAGAPTIVAPSRPAANSPSGHGAAALSVTDMARAFSEALQENAALFEQQNVSLSLDGRDILESNIRQNQTYGFSGFRGTVTNFG